MKKGAGPSRSEVRFTGFGGQGMVVMGYILGRAATVYDGKNATMTPCISARRSFCVADRIVL